MRQKLLDEGQVQEKVLWEQDIAEAEAVFVSNAIHGLMAVTYK